MPTTKQTMRLDYPVHAEEIASLNFILAALQKEQTGAPRPELVPVIEHILARLDQLTMMNYARVSLYNQHEERR